MTVITASVAKLQFHTSNVPPHRSLERCQLTHFARTVSRHGVRKLLERLGATFALAFEIGLLRKILNMPVEGASKPHYARKLLSEFVGTAFLVIVAGGGDIIEVVSGGQIGHVARYLAPGLIVVAMIWSLSAVSGAHVNPAVTLAFVLRGVFPPVSAVGYWMSQFAGGAAGALLLRLFFGASVVNAVTHQGVGVTAWEGAGWEALITAVLIVVILSTAAEKAVVGRNAALAVGFTVACCGLFSSPMTGASMNPARSFGPQLAAQAWDGAWIYFVGPFTGAIVATVICAFLHDRSTGERHAAEGTTNAA